MYGGFFTHSPGIVPASTQRLQIPTSYVFGSAQPDAFLSEFVKNEDNPVTFTGSLPSTLLVLLLLFFFFGRGGGGLTVRSESQFVSL